MRWLDFLRNLKTSDRVRAKVTVDDEEIVCRRPSGLAERVR
ncbi:MAG TPA: hypothetical protein VHC22_21365 [Pirellulales bacterium]|nr:hypothetical protein [Pirellulales bacterium]